MPSPTAAPLSLYDCQASSQMLASVGSRRMSRNVLHTACKEVMSSGQRLEGASSSLPDFTSPAAGCSLLLAHAQAHLQREQDGWIGADILRLLVQYDPAATHSFTVSVCLWR